MLLREERADVMLSGRSECGSGRLHLFAWRELFWRLPLLFRFRPAQDNPDAKLAQMLKNVRDDIDPEGSYDSSLLQRLEAQIAITNDAEVRKLLATYLSEP